MSYNLTNFTDANNLYEMAKAANKLTEVNGVGLYSVLILLSLAVLLFLVFKNYEFKKVAVANSFIVTFIAILMYLQELISIQVLAFPFVFLVVAVMLYFVLE